MVEGTAVSPEGRISRWQLGIYSDHQVEGLRQLAEAIHKDGAIAGIQIHHAGALAYTETGGSRFERLAVTAFRLAKQQLMFSTLMHIREVLIAAARRSVQSGFDIVEIHGAHGCSFHNSYPHLRTGGSIDTVERSKSARDFYLK